MEGCPVNPSAGTAQGSSTFHSRQQGADLSQICQKTHHSQEGCITYLEGGTCVQGRSSTEPAGGAGEVGIPGLVDQAGGGSPGLGLPQMMEPIGCLCIQPHTEVVEEEPLNLWSTCWPVWGVSS